MKSPFLVKLVLSLLLLNACVEPFSADLKITQKILIVDGTLTNQDTEQFISLKETNPIASPTRPLALSKATVQVVVNDKDKISLAESGTTGIYYFPKGFRASYNTNYKLYIKTAQGAEYISTNESMSPSPAIDKVYAIFEPKGVEQGNGTAPAHYIYLDTKDPIGVKNNYFWSFRVWEKQNYCWSCDGGKLYYNARTRIWECRTEPALLADGVIYDYNCDGNCWDIAYNTDINVMNDALIDGKPILGRLVAKIAYRQLQGCLVEVKQQTVSVSAFRYLRLLVEQGQSTGTLADTPPAALIGNIKNINDSNESVAGVFMVSGTETNLFWLDRKDALKTTIVPIGLLGRLPNSEPAGTDLTRPPLAPCQASKYRTPTKPTGWID